MPWVDSCCPETAVDQPMPPWRNIPRRKTTSWNQLYLALARPTWMYFVIYFRDRLTMSIVFFSGTRSCPSLLKKSSRSRLPELRQLVRGTKNLCHRHCDILCFVQLRGVGSSLMELSALHVRWRGLFHDGRQFSGCVVELR